MKVVILAGGFACNDLINCLEGHKIATRRLFGGNLTRQPAYLKVSHHVAGGLTNADTVMNHGFWVGVYPGLTQKMLRYMISVFHDFYNKRWGKCF